MKFTWKQKTCGDLSCAWFEAKIKPLNWIYIVDAGIKDQKKYTCFLWVDDKISQETRITTKEFKTVSQAQVFCEKHLFNAYQKLKLFFLKKK